MSRRQPRLRRRVATTLAVVFATFLFLLLVWSYAAERPLLSVLHSLRSSAPRDDLACFLPLSDDDGNASSSYSDFPDAASLRPTESSIFFHETSCMDDITLTYRQACAVESAARLHPHRAVYLLMLGAPRRAGRQASGDGRAARHHRPAALRALLAYANVRVAHLDVGRYARGTPLQAWFADGALASSQWLKEHAADALRFLTLWRFGGTYLDLDIVVIRSLDGLRNFAGAESAEDVAAGALGLARDEIGRRVAIACLRELRSIYSGDTWGISPAVITNVLKRLCQVDQVSQMTEERCQTFRVLPPAAFYPVPWRKWLTYFEEADTSAVINATKESYTIHVWNKFSSRVNVSLTSQQFYAQIARQFCPNVVQNAGDFF